MEKDIGKINKGEYQGTVTDIVVGIREYNERIGVDIREFVTSEKYTGPTKKGLRIPAESFQQFKEMINSIDEKDLESNSESETTEKDPEQGTLQEPEKPSENTEEQKETLPDY